MKLFFVGIKGVGMTSIATLYKEWGHEVCGSDTEEQFFTDDILKNLGIAVLSFDPKHIVADIDRVTYSSAYPKDHPQIRRAIELGIPMASYAEVLAEIFNARKGILVTGTHGKTTSTAMLGRVLEDAGFDPTVVCGGELIEWRRTARAGKGEWVISEGDEYQAKILILKPYALLLTNIEYDHPDYYKDEAAYRGTFEKLLQSMPSESIVVAHESTRELVEKNAKGKVIYYTEDQHMDLGVWGAHNRANATGVMRLAVALGVSEEKARNTLKIFRGTRRRMELYTARDADVVLMDDYAHHPTEIKATLAALRAEYPQRTITAAFQPHTYSRTKVFLDDFAGAFEDADNVILLDIYGSAREQEVDGVGEELARAVARKHPSTQFAQSLDAAYNAAKALLGPQSVFVTLGAGDVWQVAKRLSSEAGGQ